MNNQLPIALHIVGFLASANGAPLTSQTMANVYGTSPVMLRRVLGKLQRAGIVDTQRGLHGGSLLSRTPSRITLREVYEAVQGEKSVLPKYSDKCSGPVAPVLGDYLNDLFLEAEEALLARLEKVSVAQMDRAVRQKIVRAHNCARTR